MNIFFPEHDKMLRKLSEYNVRYLLIGGYAVNYYGYHRTTGDMDLWISSDAVNIKKLQDIFLKMGFLDRDVAHLSTLDFEQPNVFSIGAEPQRIDFITRVNIVQFDEAYAQKNRVQIEEGFSIDIVHYRDLVTMKLNTGRLKDKADVEELQKVNRDANKG